MRERCGLRKKKKTTKMESNFFETMKWTFKKHMFLFPGQKNCPKAICSKFHILTHRHISSVKAMFHHQSGILAQKKNAGQPPTHRISKKKTQTTTQSP